jgi:hypothetical protein
MTPSRIPALAFAADIVAVIVFAAVGRASHAEPGDVLGLLATLAPFAVGLVAAWATPVVRARPAGLPAGLVVVAGTVAVGLLLRFAFTERMPLSFAIVSVLSLTVLMIGWRALSFAVSRRARDRVRW